MTESHSVSVENEQIETAQRATADPLPFGPGDLQGSSIFETRYEQDNGEGLLGDPPDVFATSNDLIDAIVWNSICC